MKKQLTEYQVAEILLERARGVTVNELASKYKVDRSTIWRRSRNFYIAKRLVRKRANRRLKITSEQLMQLKDFLKSNPFSSREETIAKLKLPICAKTLTLYMERLKLKQSISPKRFFVREHDCEERMIVAIRRSFWTLDRWRKVIFCDESSIDNSGFHRRYVVRPPLARFDRKFIYRAPNKTLKVNFFTWISTHGPGEILTFERMNSTTYCEVIERMIERLREQFDEDDFLIVHDNAKFSQSVQTHRFIRQRNWNHYFLSIPPYSPDMNPIENAFAYLKQQVRKNCFANGQTRSRERFISLIDQSWADIPSQMIRSLYRSLPERMDHIARSQGYPTKY